MSLWRDLLTWGSGPEPTPPREPARPSDAEFMRPASLNFSLELPPEMAVGGYLADGSLEPRVGREVAMSVPAVKRARDLIAGTLGSVPIQAYNPNREAIPNPLLNQPEIDFARSVTMTRTIEDMLFEGRSWWRITKFGWHGYPVKVRRLEPRSVIVREDAVVFESSDGTPQGMAMVPIPDAELIRIESPNDPLLKAGARAIRACLLLDQTASRYAKNPVPQGYFTPADDMADPTEDEVTQILDKWAAANGKRSWAYVSSALKANLLQWNPEQLQLGAARDYAALEIARLAGVDPEDLGINTTSRTYQNAEMRRLDLLDFTLKAYVTAVEDRLSMGDVLPLNHYARYQFDSFLRSDTESRMNVYKIGREVGVYNDERIAKLENIPTAKVPKPPAPAAPAAPEGAPVKPPVAAAREIGLTFADAEQPFTIGFAMDSADVAFKVDTETRTVTGIAVPWNQVGYASGRKWMFTSGSLSWGSDTSRVKLNRDHDRMNSFGYAAKLTDGTAGLMASFKVARGPEGDAMLAMAQDKVYDGFSIEANVTDWSPHAEDESIAVVRAGTLAAVALTAMPAFDGARVAAVAASREEPSMKTAAELAAEAAAAAATEQSKNVDLAAFTAGLTESIGTAVATAFAALPTPQVDPGRQVIPAGRAATVTREAPVYAMNGSGHSMVRDAWKSRTEGDSDARDRLAKFTAQTQDAAKAAAESLAFGPANTGNSGAVIPPGYRPDLYVTQLMQGRPLVEAVSRGTLTDATPFTLPSFTSATSMTSTHTEGVNPTSGTLTIATKTVTPGSISGVFQLTREIVDSSNPAIDAIAMQAMQESYSQQTEAKVYAELNGANGQGGTITAGFVPSGAQAILVSGGNGDGTGAAGTSADGADLIARIRQQEAVYPFRRFAAPDRALMSAEATNALATAVGTDGRPLLPSIGAQNTAGVGNAINQGWYIDGLPFQPAWSMSGNAVGDADVFMFNHNDVWFWESGLLTFRFEERSGPANIDLALFGYSATRLLRPIGLSALRYSTVPLP
jgi:phage head maturation protease